MAGDEERSKPAGSKDAQDGQRSSPSSNFAERLNKLEADLVKKGAFKKQNSTDERSETSASTAQAMKISSEFIAGIIVGALIGWFIDRVAATSPWGLIIFLMLGFGAGVLNVLRTVGKVAEKADFSSKLRKDEKE